MSSEAQSLIKKVADIIKHSKRLLFITGAGISAESGIPTYRGIGGLYNGRLTDLDLPIEEVLSGRMMRSNPELTWRYLSEIEQATRGAIYNEAHRIIAELGKNGRDVFVLTQNVDGFHTAAGSDKVIEIHGNLHHLRCDVCGCRLENVDYATLDVPPECPNCSSIMRPDVVLFGEMLDETKIAQISAILSEHLDSVFSVGTSSLFPYITGPVRYAATHNIPTIEINPDVTEISNWVDYKIKEGAVKALQAIQAAMV
jgi:NAD-dependent deacetylase